MRLAAIAAALAICTVTMVTSETAEAQRRRRGRADRDVPAAASSASAQDEEARRLFESGEAAYDEGRYESALDDFTRAYALSGRPGLLFNIGSVSERLRRDREALRAYEGYLEAVPDAPNREFAESRITFLRAQLAQDASRAADDEVATAGAAQPAAAVRAPVDEDLAGPQREGRRDAEALRSPIASTPVEPAVDAGGGGGDVTGEWWLWTLVGLAVVGAGVGVGAAIASSDPGSSGAPVSGDFGPGGVIVALGSW